ncbi:MAG: AAA family ATPase [Verrucomicrobiota bacterium]
MISEVTIKRFKNIEEVTLPLQRINLLVGSNNSGKSSILQAIQFGVSIAQTLKLSGSEWKRGVMKRSMPSSQLVYTPLRDIASLRRNRAFRETYSGVEIVLEGVSPKGPAQPGGPPVPPAPKSIITMNKGRGEFIVCAVSGLALGRELAPINPPFSVYVPGLAGIPVFEEYRSDVLIRRAAARGDANSVFRNILWLLKNDTAQWVLFTQDLKRIFPEVSIIVSFNLANDEHINAQIKVGGTFLPIDAAGTGVLQAIQILAYVNLYKPQLLILDEPDAHLHPNNQRRLAQVLIDLAEMRKFQIVLSTHSRHLLDAMQNDAKVHWICKGKRIADEEYSDLAVLMDVGALDKGDLLKAGLIKCIVLTEDEDVVCIRTLCEAAGFDMDETEFWSYKGCTNIDTALALHGFISNHAAAVKILVHRDRDYYNQSEVESFEVSLKKGAPNGFVYITNGTDAESHFLNPKHFVVLDSKLELDVVSRLIDEATNETSEYSIGKFINSRTPLEMASLRKEGKQIDNAKLASACRIDYHDNTARYRHGKKVLKTLRNLLQVSKLANPDPFQTSLHIKDPALEKIAEAIWSA